MPTEEYSMTYKEFVRFAIESVVDGFLREGLKGIRREVEYTVIQEVARAFKWHGGFKEEQK